MNRNTFAERYCAIHQCSTGEFPERVFWQCIPAQSSKLARMVWPINPSLFVPDFALIQQLADTHDPGEMHSQIEQFRYHYRPGGLLRGKLRVRVSGKLLLKLGAEVFSRKLPTRRSGNPILPAHQMLHSLSQTAVQVR